MQKTTIVVPKGIRYIGDWKEFQLSNFPAKCIINKVLPGCGFTRYCIDRQFENVILCSPRKMLLQNKYDQHKTQAYLVVNEYDQDPGVDMDITKDRKVIDKKELDKIRVTEIKARLHRELREYMTSHLQWKILVTYDSFRILKEVLEEMQIFNRFYVVIDEMQAVMQDARFKSSTEVSFLYHLQNSHSALFVSATPMLEEYLDELDEFKDLPYFEFDWKTEDFSRIVKPDLEVKKMQSITVETKKILDKFLKGNYDELTIFEDGQPKTKKATELVFYVNSVAAIIRIISASKLTDSQVNILCSNTEENQKKIWKRLGGKKTGEYKIGRVPIEGESHKPITLCTRTVYLGADFYSNCAKSYIFSDPNSDYLSVDISQDLPQILGRQRCDDNPWKNSATLFYRTTIKSKIKDRQEFMDLIREKREDTQTLLEVWQTGDSAKRKALLPMFYDSILVSHYKNNYVAVNVIKGINPETGQEEFMSVPVENHLVRVAERRAFDIQQIDYADRFSVFMTLSKEFGDGFNKNSSNQDPVEFQVTEFFKVYEELTKISDKLRLLCETGLTIEARSVILAQLPDTDKVKYFYQALGPERCKANSYSPSEISKELGVKFFSKAEVAKEVYKEFSEGQKRSLSDIKQLLRSLYERIDYNKTPKAIDIQDFFETKEIKIADKITGKRIKAYHLIKKLL